MYVLDVDSGAPKEIVPYDGSSHSLGCWTADGKSVIYRQRADAGYDLWIVEIDTLERRPLLVTPPSERNPSMSPDGRWLAYESDETGRSEVYVATYPELKKRTRISTDSGFDPCWNGDGTELFYRCQEGVFAVAFAKDGPVDDAPELVLPDSGDDLQAFNVTPDGQRFLVMRADRATRQPPDQLITDWPRLLDQ